MYETHIIICTFKTQRVWKTIMNFSFTKDKCLNVSKCYFELINVCVCVFFNKKNIVYYILEKKCLQTA